MLSKFQKILAILVILIISSCSNSDSSEPDLTDKAFYGVAVTTCPSTNITNLTSEEYVLMTFVDSNGNSISYQPSVNTWYKMDNSNTYVKTGTDVSPKEATITWDFKTTTYSSPCQ
jgi:hypothetical protein